MSDVFKRITNVELRIQWTGAWDGFYSANHDGFPGIEVPLELAALVRQMKDNVVKVDTDYYKASVEAEVRGLFETVVGAKGPGNQRWIPLAASWTTSSHIRWVGLDADSIAFPVGQQAKTAPGKIDDAAPKLPYEDAYDFGASTRGRAQFWVCFSFAEA